MSRWDFCSWDLVEARWTASLTYVRHLHQNVSVWNWGWMIRKMMGRPRKYFSHIWISHMASDAYIQGA